MNGFIIQYFPDGGIAIVNAGNAEAPSAFLGALLVLLFAVPAWRAYADFRRRWAQGNRAARLNLLATLGAFCLAISIHGSGKQSATNLMFGGSTQGTVTNTVNGGGTGQQSGINGSGTFSSTRSSLLPSDYVQGGMPSWWQYDPTSTIMEGMPDLWLKWTRYDVALYGTDPGVDRDGDGLNELEEFWWACDPRTESTMGTGYPDGWAVEYNIDPLDETLAGQDLSGDGLTTIEAYHFGKDPRDPTPIPPITLDNGAGDITFALSKPIPAGAVAIFALDGQSYPLLHANTSITVSFPNNVTVPFSFTPPQDMGDVGMTMSGDLKGLVLNDPSGVFGEPTSIPQGGTALMSSDGGDISRYPDFGISPPSGVIHYPGDQASFSVTGLPSTVSSDVTWTFSGGGALEPATGLGATFTSNGGGTTVTATFGATSNAASAIVIKCTDYAKPSVSVEATSPVSPHLGETCHITATCTPGSCPHNVQERDVFVQITGGRKTSSLWQYAASIDSRAISSHTTIATSWDVKGNAAQANSSDLFTGATPPFNRVLPASSGGILPPPFAHVRAEAGGINGSNEATATVHVPQVVKVAPDTGVVSLLQQSLYCHAPDFGATNELLYAGCSYSTATNLVSGIATNLQAMIPAGVNIRVVGPNVTVAGEYKTINITTNGGSGGIAGWVDAQHRHFKNDSADGIGNVTLAGIREAIQIIRVGVHLAKYEISQGLQVTQEHAVNIWGTTPLPIEPEALTFYMTDTALHELGHTFDLVSPTHLGGDGGWHNINPGSGPPPAYVMNDGTTVPFIFKFGSMGRRPWKALNHHYLQFILPTPP